MTEPNPSKDRKDSAFSEFTEQAEQERKAESYRRWSISSLGSLFLVGLPRLGGKKKNSGE